MQLDSLIRMVNLTDARFEVIRSDGGDKHDTLGTLRGYAAVYGQPTIIDNPYEGRFEEQLMHGTFRDFLKDHADNVRCIYEHGLDPSIGLKPIGKPRSMTEDDYGLLTETPIDDTSYNRDMVASLRSGALDGMSVRMAPYRVDEGKRSDGLETRVIKGAHLREFSVTSIPAYKGAVAGLRSATDYARWQAGATADTGGPPSVPVDTDSTAEERARILEQVRAAMDASR